MTPRNDRASQHSDAGEARKEIALGTRVPSKPTSHPDQVAVSGEPQSERPPLTSHRSGGQDEGAYRSN